MPKNPLGKIKDAADVAVTTAVSTAVGAGQKVAGQVVGTAVTAVGAVTSKVPGREKQSPPETRLRAVPQDAAIKTHGDPVAPGTNAPVKKSSATKAPARKPTATTAPVKAAPKKAVPKQAPAKKATSKKATNKKATSKKAPAKKLAAAGKPEIPTPDETALAKKAAQETAHKTTQKSEKSQD